MSGIKYNGTEYIRVKYNNNYYCKWKRNGVVYDYCNRNRGILSTVLDSFEYLYDFQGDTDYITVFNKTDFTPTFEWKTQYHWVATVRVEVYDGSRRYEKTYTGVEVNQVITTVGSPESVSTAEVQWKWYLNEDNLPTIEIIDINEPINTFVAYDFDITGTDLL